MKTYLQCLILLLFTLSSGASWGMVEMRGKKALEQIENHKQELHKKISWVDVRIEKTLRKNEEIEKEVEPLGQLRKEYFLRLDLYNRLALGIESHYRGGDLKIFLSDYLLKISEIELKNNSHENLWKATLYMGKALETIPERFEDPIDFLNSYMEFSTISQPKSPKEFAANRNYTNGSEFESGNPMAREQVGKNLPRLNTPVTIEVKKVIEPPSEQEPTSEAKAAE